MIRNKSVPASKIQVLQERIETLGVIARRASLAARLGKQQYGGDRNISQALGYLNDISYDDYFGRYSRQDIAKAIIDRPVKATWSGDLQMLESNDDKETKFEKTWDEMEDTLHIKAVFSKLDRLACIGNYAVLLLGFDDVKQKEDFLKPVISSKKLLYIRAFGFDNAKINTYETDTNQPRYGLPLTYSIEISKVDDKTTQTVIVHHSRVIHVAYDTLESEIEGTPVLMAVFNRLMDVEKLVGGDAEMFWRGARPGYHAGLKDDFTMTPVEYDKLQNQIDEYEHNLRRILVNEGLEMNALDQQIADPAGHLDIQLQMISAVTGIPKRILVGSERGELASTQDSDEWLSLIQNRRQEYAEPYIVRPFVKVLQTLKILPETTDGYDVKWSDLFASGEKDKAEIGRVRAEALRAYGANATAESVVPPDAFLEYFLGLTKEQIEVIEEMREQQVIDEQKEIDEMMKLGLDQFGNPIEQEQEPNPEEMKNPQEKPQPKIKKEETKAPPSPKVKPIIKK